MNLRHVTANLKAALQGAGRCANVFVNHAACATRPTAPAMLAATGSFGTFATFSALQLTKPSRSSSVVSSQNWQIGRSYEDRLNPGGVCV